MRPHQIITFQVGSKWYGLDVSHAREVARIQKISPVPELMPPLMGLVNLRGQILLAVELRILLRVEDLAPLENRELLILKGREERQGAAASDGESPPARDALGLLVDAVGDVLDVSDEVLHPAPENITGKDREFIEGVFDQDGALIPLLSVKALTRASFYRTP